MKIKLENFKSTLSSNYILLITSNSIEKNSVNEIIIPKTKVEINLNCKGCYIGVIQNNIVVHISGTSGLVSEDSISRIVIEFISNNDFPKPKAVLMTGFCWGNPNKTKSNQTIISNTVYSLNSVVIKGDTLQFKEKIYQSKLHKEYLISDTLNGAIVSLETLITGNEYRDNIISLYPTILGGEMEGFGFIPSLESREIPWLLMKTISDFADNQFGREIQIEAATNSAKLLPNLINELAKEFEEYNSDKNLNHIKNILLGNTIHLKSSDFSEENLNDFLNDIIGPVVESKLQEYFYATDKTGDSTFVRCFCDAILEIAQNSFKHGNSTEFEISFFPKSIVLQDNGDSFDVSQITGDRGGAKAWDNIKNLFIDKGVVRFSHIKPNIYKFHLTNVKEFLINLREKCSVSIRPGTVGVLHLRQQILEYDAKCTSVYIKDKHNRMSSRRHSIIEQVKTLLEKGITVYLSVENEHEAQEYKNKLIDFEESLIVLYD